MRRFLPALVVFASIVTLALAGFYLSLRSFRSDTQNEFDESARLTSTLLQHSLAEKLLLLESIHSLFAVFDGRPQPQFRRFMQPFEQELDGVQALQWTLPVTREQRLEFETAMQQQSVTGFMITERDALGRMTRAADRPLHFPIYPLSPLDEGESTIGFDLASSEARLAAIQKAIASGTLTLTQRIELLQGDGRSSGFLAFKPLFSDNQLPVTGSDPLATLRGLVVGVFDIDAIFNEVVATTPTAAVDYTLRDLDAPTDASLLLEYRSAGAAARSDAPLGWQPTGLALRFSAGDRQWELVTNPGVGYMQQRQPDSAWFILSVGLLLACILAYYLVEQTRSHERIKANEAERLSLENQLFRSQKMEAVGRLVGGIAHDFNNLLTSILGYAELAQFERDPQQTEEYLRLIQQGGERGKGLIRKLLSFSRSDHLEHTPQHLPPLVEQTLLMLKPVMPRSIDIQFDSERGLPQVSIDPTSLDQVLVNLCINARDAIGQRGLIRVSLKQTHVKDCHCTSCEAAIDGLYVSLEVEDNGSGMPQDTLASIFKPFYTTKEAGKGTGLGLSIIHNITHGCRGHIVVRSWQGTGTRFQLLLPIAEVPTAALRKTG